MVNIRGVRIDRPLKLVQPHGLKGWSVMLSRDAKPLVPCKTVFNRHSYARLRVGFLEHLPQGFGQPRLIERRDVAILVEWKLFTVGCDAKQPKPREFWRAPDVRKH